MPESDATWCAQSPTTAKIFGLLQFFGVIG